MQLYNSKASAMLVKPTDVLPIEDIAGIARRSTWITVWAIGSCYLAIFGSILAFDYTLTHYSAWAPVIALLAIIVIGSRQFALTILMHDAAHYALLPDKKFNDVVANWFCGYPVLGHTQGYRKVHFKHHQHTEQDADPDLWLSRRYPIPASSLVRKFMRDLTGIAGFRRVYQTIASAFRIPTGSEQSGFFSREISGFTRISGFIAANLVIFLLMSLINPWYYLWFWWVPFLTWYSFIYRLRHIAEHAMVPAESHMNVARTTKVSPLIAWSFAPFHVNYHAEHHLFPAAPWYSLPKLHQKLEEAGKLEQLVVADSYIDVLKMVVKPT